MQFRLLDVRFAADRKAWEDAWARWPAREVAAHPEYARLFARTCDRVVCALGEGDGAFVLFPLILRPISAEPWAGPRDGRWDAVTPYGYGGPFAWGASDDHARYWEAYEDWCRGARIVSTFARLSLFPDQLARLPVRTEDRAPNVVVPLEGGEEALRREYQGKVRRWVRVAERAGLHVEPDLEGARLDDFVRIYRHTMERNGADAWYFFPREFFDAIVERLRGQFAFFHAITRGEVVSSDLVLLSAENVYYFLGGTVQAAFPLGPNYLLKDGIARWAIAHGKRRYVLGGGHEPYDSLYRYKRAYARKGEVPFRVATWVHDESAYAELARERAAFAARGATAWSPRPGFFPAYRG
ncbi:MAG TPA: GNAT family N-acetyltransferase [Anaeromyxobacter sp.]|jgi:hypothetical protein|nr:GNAT family N-acetyltransferase [Anaeromyxobacter sp.]